VISWQIILNTLRIASPFTFRDHCRSTSSPTCALFHVLVSKELVNLLLMKDRRRVLLVRNWCVLPTPPISSLAVLLPQRRIPSHMIPESTHLEDRAEAKVSEQNGNSTSGIDSNHQKTSQGALSLIRKFRPPAEGRLHKDAVSSG
jgi:hypothetical protein